MRKAQKNPFRMMIKVDTLRSPPYCIVEATLSTLKEKIDAVGFISDDAVARFIECNKAALSNETYSKFEVVVYTKEFERRYFKSIPLIFGFAVTRFIFSTIGMGACIGVIVAFIL